MITVPKLPALPAQRASDVVVRPMNRSDDLAALNRGNPVGWQALAWEELAQEAPDFPFFRFTGLLDGRAVGFATVTPVPVAAGGCGSAAVHVLPEARRHGVGSALLTAVAGAVRGECPGIVLSHDEQDEEAGAAATRWGLQQLGRHVQSVLDLTALDPIVFGAAVARAKGVRLAPLPADADEAQWRSLHAFVQARMRETPDAADGGGELPYDVFRGAVREPWMALVAEQAGDPVGVTCVLRRAGEPTAVNTMLTGVVPEARGLGLSVALKARHAQLLSGRGMTRLYTQNLLGNAPILAANARLGFVPESSVVDVLLPLDQAR